MFTPILSSVFKRACFTLFSLCLISSVSFSQWVIENSGSAVNLFSISIVDANTSIIVGKGPLPYNLHGEFIRTSNAGSIWQIVRADSNFRPSDIQFVNQSTGFAVGGFYSSQFICFKTTDGGLNWDTVYWGSGSFESAKLSVSFINSQTGFACGYGKIISMTTNAGSNWSIVFNPNNLPGIRRLNSIIMTDSQNGWSVGDTGLIVKTSDSGLNWNFINSETQINLLSVKFVDLNTGYVVGDSGFISKTTNSGLNWNVQNSNTIQNLKCVTFVNMTTGYIAGGNGLILKTTNAGAIWFPQTTNVTDTLRSVKFIGTDTGYVVGDNGRILKTVNGGVIGIAPITGIIPKEFSLQQNYPNPFNPSTKIEFAIPKSSFVKIVIYDMLGREVATIVNEELKSGAYSVSWDAAQYSSGVYFYKLIADNFVQTKKMSLIK